MSTPRKPHFEVIQKLLPAVAQARYSLDTDTQDRVQNRGILARMAGLRAYLSDPRSKPYRLTYDGAFEYSPEVLSYYMMFKAEGGQIFKMAREFSEELAKVDLDVKVSFIPVSKKLLCIEFPEHVRFDLGGDRYAHCVYTYVTDERSSTADGMETPRYFEMFFPLYDRDGNLTSEVHQFGLPLTDLDKTFSEMLTQCREREVGMTRAKKLQHLQNIGRLHGDFVESVKHIEYDYGFKTDCFSFILKCYLYIHSGDPDLRDYRAPRPPTTGKVKKQRIWQRLAENQSMLDMVLVGFNFKKPTVYTVGQTTVSGHFRWQPYGERYSQVKLIWIQPHERHFKNHEESVEG